MSVLTQKTIGLIDLSKLQHDSVVSDAKRLLVLAGAGSGKTKTLLEKIKYLIEQKGVQSSDILAITFTKNAANEMIDRLIVGESDDGRYLEIMQAKNITSPEKEAIRRENVRRIRWIDGLTIKTFHSFCYSVLRKDVANEYDNQFRIISDNKFESNEVSDNNSSVETVLSAYEKILIEFCSDPAFLIKVKRYILDYFVDKIQNWKEAPEVKHKDGKYYTSLNGTMVRSKSEQYIADWLFRHNIKFEYELKIDIKGFPFKPDFYLPAANLYIEHISDKSYPMKDKIEEFEKAGFAFVRTYESMANNTALFNHSLDHIIKNRLPGKEYGKAALVYLEEFNRYHEPVKKFLLQIIRVMDMMKGDYISTDEVANRAASDKHDRITGFYEIAIPLIKAYKEFCTKRSYLDFNDLISTTKDLFEHHPDIRHKYQKRYKYILVDEFQDVNRLQVDLLRMLLTDDTQLFCVGDDWQSIYGFRGSDVGYIVEFEKHFPGAKVIKLDKNYRSTQNIVEASNELIKQNKFKIEKEVVASRFSEHKIVVFAGKSEQENVQFCEEMVRQLSNEGVSGEEILFLYRRSAMFTSYHHRLKDANLVAQRRTIHAAKGLEAKVVFIIGLTDGSGGFPDIWLEDRVFQMVRQGNYDLLLEEERRLFYVAITRAKDKLFLITEKGRESSFINEIPASYIERVHSIPLAAETIQCNNCKCVLERRTKFCPECGAMIRHELN